MTERERLLIALSQVENLGTLLEDNEWKNFLYQHLIPLKYEIQRQIGLITESKPNIED